MTAGEAGARVAGIVLAAGRSRRMGRPKALLDAGGRPFIRRAVETLAAGGCEPVVAVVRADHAAAAAAALAGGALVVRNPDPDSEPADSLRLALDTLAKLARGAAGSGPAEAEPAGAAVLPVDHPWVEPATVAELVARFLASLPPVLRPVHGGRPGHPTIFARALFEELRAGGLPEGARSVIERHGDRVVDVPVEDPGVTEDLDTPAEWRAAARRRGLHEAAP